MEVRNSCVNADVVIELWRYDELYSQCQNILTCLRIVLSEVYGILVVLRVWPKLLDLISQDWILCRYHFPGLGKGNRNDKVGCVDSASDLVWVIRVDWIRLRFRRIVT